MKKLIKYSINTGRIATVCLLLLAVTLSGANAAERLFSAYDEFQPELASPTPELKAGPPAPEDVPENMEPNGRPCCEQPARLVASWNLSSKDNLRIQKLFAADPVFATATVGQRSFARIKTSTGLISSMLSRQFTLVGAKPSGTS
jgi:hypothetical protein